MFTYHTSVKMHHTDAAGLIFFGRLYNIIHDAGEAFMKEMGFSIAYILNNEDFILPIVHSEADYKAPLRLGDEIRVELNVGKIGGSSFSLEYSVKKGEDTLCAKSQTIHVAVNKKTGKKMNLPENVREALEKQFNS